jgi:ubiquinone/menaquinone biosynthesis C-methylase UbiE
VPLPDGYAGSPAGTAATHKHEHRGHRSWLRAKQWDNHVEHLEEMAASPGFLELRDRILGLAQLLESDCVLDVGAGTGLLALAAARRVARVMAIDISPVMGAHLQQKLARQGLHNTEVQVGNATALPLAGDSVDVVVSNYCFHHLRDSDKLRALAEAKRVLRPGGRLVVGDVMFRIGVVSRRDRAVIALFIRRMLRHGPAGLLRLMRNATRLLAGRWEHPASIEWWRQALTDAGFEDVDVHALAHEGGIAVARKPA